MNFLVSIEKKTGIGTPVSSRDADVPMKILLKLSKSPKSPAFPTDERKKQNQCCYSYSVKLPLINL